MNMTSVVNKINVNSLSLHILYIVPGTYLRYLGEALKHVLTKLYIFSRQNILTRDGYDHNFFIKKNIFSVVLCQKTQYFWRYFDFFYRNSSKITLILFLYFILKPWNSAQLSLYWKNKFLMVKKTNYLLKFVF